MGPNRNLASLIASVIFMHPNTQVLNHAGGRILGRRKYDFLRDYSEAKFNAFCHYALYMSTRGQRGSYGGSITHSIAFSDFGGVKECYQSRYGNELWKEKVKTLIWKEPFKITQAIQKCDPKAQSLMDQCPRLRFIMPIRNPLACALSNYRLGPRWVLQTLGGREFSVEAVLDKLFHLYAFFLKLEKAYPSRCLKFFEAEITPDLFPRIAKLLEIPMDDRWQKDSLKFIRIRNNYQYPESLRKQGLKMIDLHFADEPQFAESLRRSIQ